MSLRDIYNLKPIRDKGFVFKSGKYANHTLGELIDDDPEYILFLQTKTNMDFHADIIDECERVSQGRSRDSQRHIDVNTGGGLGVWDDAGCHPGDPMDYGY